MSYKLKKYNHISFLMVCIFFHILHPTMGNYLIIDKRTNCLLYKDKLSLIQGRIASYTRANCNSPLLWGRLFS